MCLGVNKIQTHTQKVSGTSRFVLHLLFFIKREMNSFPWVTLSLAGILVIVYFLTKGSKVDCSSSPKAQVERTFRHADTRHLVNNLFGLAILVKFEALVGSALFLGGMVLIFLLTQLLEPIVRAITNYPCSVGFSGVILGGLVWSIGDDPSLIYKILSIATFSAIMPNISFWGHIIGIFAGAITYFALGSLQKNPNKLQRAEKVQ